MKNLKREIEKLRRYSFEMGPIRPPSEGGSYSLLIRATRNCPWNKCKFCDQYKGKKFSRRSIEEINQDIDEVKGIADAINVIKEKLGGMDWTRRVIDPLFLYEKDFGELNEKESKNIQCLINVYNWLCSRGRTAFLQDANSLIMRPSELIEVVNYLKETFPSIERVTSYARSKTLSRKSLDDLKAIRRSGLSRLHVGLESGDDDVLKYVNKGVTANEHVLGGRKAKEAGFELSEYVMPGLGGKKWSEQHAKNTASVLNEINPDFIRSRPYIPRKGTPLFEEYERGAFQLTSPHERLREIKVMVEHLNVTSKLCFDHFIMNSWYKDQNRSYPLFKLDYNGYKFPEEKDNVLTLIEKGLAIDESIHVHAKDLVELPYL